MVVQHVKANISEDGTTLRLVTYVNLVLQPAKHVQIPHHASHVNTTIGVALAKTAVKVAKVIVSNILDAIMDVKTDFIELMFRIEHTAINVLQHVKRVIAIPLVLLATQGTMGLLVNMIVHRATATFAIGMMEYALKYVVIINILTHF